MSKYHPINRNSLGQFKRGLERLFHLSAPLAKNPKAAMAESHGKMFLGPQFLVVKGTTYKKPCRNEGESGGVK